MNSTKNYNTSIIRRKGFIVFCAAVFVITLVITYAVCMAESPDLTCWILCKPKSIVYVRRDPAKSSEMVGRLECGDEIQTDGKTRNGWIHVNGIGEFGSGWVYCGFVSLEQPENVDEQYVCVAKKQVACRRWMDGPQISGKLGWLHNGSNVTVFYIADGWAVTSRGYIKAEFLEVDPR